MYREVILDAAEQVFAADGFESAKMQAVATAAGVSSSTVYTAFAGKWDLFRAVHERRGRELLEQVASHPDVRSAPLPRLLGGVRAYATYLMTRPHYLRMLGHAKVWTAGERLPSKEQSSTAIRGAGLVQRAFSDGIAEGTFYGDDPDLMTRLMHATQQVRLLDWLERGMQQSPDEVVAALEREVIRMFVVPERIAELLAEHAASA